MWLYHNIAEARIVFFLSFQVKVLLKSDVNLSCEFGSHVSNILILRNILMSIINTFGLHLSGSFRLILFNKEFLQNLLIVFIGIYFSCTWHFYDKCSCIKK